MVMAASMVLDAELPFIVPLASRQIQHLHVIYTFLSRYLNYSITAVRSQDTLRIIENIALRPNQSSLAWNFVKQNWAYLAAK